MKTGGSFKIGAIIIGWLVDVVGSAIVGGIAALIMVGPAAMKAIKQASQNPQGARNPAVTQTQMENLASTVNNSSLPLVMLLIGCLFSVVGGFVAARLAKQGEFKNGLAVGLLSLFLSLFFIFVRRGVSAPADAGWFGAITPFVGVPLSAFGGYLGSLIRRPEVDEMARAGSPPLPPV